MAKKNVEDMSVEELRAKAAKEEIEGRSAMKKDELVEALSTDKTKTAESDIGDEAGTPDMGPSKPELEGMHIEGTAKEGKGETRLYQTDPNTKTWLSKAEALKKGFYWKD